MEKDFQSLRRTVAANVRRLRNRRGMSQEALAFEAEIDRTYVSQIERAVINPSLLVLHKVARALHVSVIDLMRGAPS
jgi:transcriptional regulator with XRE-family HTH domain